jgi:carboxyl-terminal processing protease
MRYADTRATTRGGVIAAAALLLGSVPLAAQARSNYEELQTFSAVLNQIRVNYVDTVRYAQLVRAAIDGVLRSLDPHSRFVPREDVARMDALARGELGSVGLVLEDVDAVPTVLTVIAGSPADKKGVMAGDRLVAVDDTTIAGLEAKAVELKLAGRRGSKVTLSLDRGSRFEPETYRVTLKRLARRIHRTRAGPVGRSAEPAAARRGQARRARPAGQPGWAGERVGGYRFDVAATQHTRVPHARAETGCR